MHIDIPAPNLVCSMSRTLSQGLSCVNWSGDPGINAVLLPSATNISSTIVCALTKHATKHQDKNKTNGSIWLHIKETEHGTYRDQIFDCTQKT